VATNDVELFAGDSLDIYCTVKDPYGVLVDLSTAQAIYAISKAVGDAEPLVTKESTASGEINLSATGDMVVHLRSDDTVGMAQGGYYHEAQITLTDGRVGTVLYGKFKIKQNLIAPR
jgi:hypothetical protein